MPQKIIIIGNGVAGITAALELRRLQPSAEISVISKESPYFFSRTALMYEFCGQMSKKDLEPFERATYQRQKINLIHDTVLSLNPEGNSLQLANHHELTFDKLLLATGSQPRKFSWQTKQLKNIGNFVSLQDLDWLKANHRPGQVAAVVGGGLIGIEVAEVLLAAGLEVHFIIREEWFWPVALNQAESSFVAEHLTEHGLKVHLGVEVLDQEIENDKITKLQLSNNQELEIDLLIGAIGVEPATDFLSNSGIELDSRFKAIETNKFLQTNYPNIYAAGDSANVEWFNGVRRPEQIWYTAKDQGKIAARNISGEEQPYQRGILYNSSKLFDIEYTTAGLVNFQLDNLSEWYQQVPGEYVSQRIVLQNGKVIGFNMLGSRWNHQLFIQWIQEERDLAYVLSHLAEATFDAEFSPFKFKVYSSAIEYAL